MITGESLTLLEEFLVRRRMGISESTETEARRMDGFLVLREQIEQEERDDTSEY